MTVPYRLNDGAPMRPYQMAAAHEIFKDEPDSGTPLILDMGLGKTAIVLTAIKDLITWGRLTKPVLVVAPILVCETVWRQEARIWSHTTDLTFSLLRGEPFHRRFRLHQPADIYLINPEGLDWLYKELRCDWSVFDMLVVDESSIFKTHNGKRFKLLTNYGDRHAIKGEDGKALRDANGKLIHVGPNRFKYTVICTGTPAPTSLLHLWPQMYIVDGGTRLHKEFDTYRDRFFFKTAQVAEHTFKWEVSEEELEVRPEWQPKDGAPEKIHELIADITIELDGAAYGVLPATIGDASKGEVPPSHLHYIDLPDAARKYYDTMEKEALVELGKDFVIAANGGAKTQLCWQIANGFMYWRDEFGDQKTEPMHDAKLDKMVELVNLIPGSTIVTYYFKADYARITERLRKENIPFSTLGGSCKNPTKIIEDWNAGKIPVLLLHPQAAAHGVNLQYGGHQIIWFTMIWSLERYLQTLARVARSGQKYICGFHHIIARNTLDEVMLTMLGQRGDVQDRFRAALRAYQALRGWSLPDAMPSGTPFSAPLSALTPPNHIHLPDWL